MALNRHLKMGMIGGGPGAFIGDVHRKASRLDGGIDLVAGAFDINPRKSKQMGRELLLNSKRVYGTYEQMIEKELKLPEGERIDFAIQSLDGQCPIGTLSILSSYIDDLGSFRYRLESQSTLETAPLEDTCFSTSFPLVPDENIILLSISPMIPIEMIPQIRYQWEIRTSSN